MPIVFRMNHLEMICLGRTLIVVLPTGTGLAYVVLYTNDRSNKLSLLLKSYQHLYIFG